MPVCQNCHKRWSWQQMFKKQFNLMGEIKCPYCGEKQYYTKQTKKWSGIISAITVMSIMTANLIFGPSYIWFILLLLFLPIYLLVFPFVAKLSKHEEHMF